MKKSILCGILFSSAFANVAAQSVAPDAITFHIASYHGNSKANNNNYGIGFRWLNTDADGNRSGSGPVTGFYYNSFRRNSFYAGYNFSYQMTEKASIGMTVGGVTGYPVLSDQKADKKGERKWAAVSPFLTPNLSYAITKNHYGSINYIPKARKEGSEGIHFSYGYVF